MMHQSQGWHDDMGSRQLRPKGRGKGLMSSEELQRAQQSDPAFPHSARENLKTAVKFAEFKYTR